MKRNLIALAACLVLSLAACSPTSEAEEFDALPTAVTTDEASAIAQDYDYEWEAEVLSDGQISPAEYEEAHDKYMECQVGLGYTVKQTKALDPIENLQWFSVVLYEGTEDATDMGKTLSTTCDHRYFTIETPYLAVSTGHISPELLPSFTACLATIPAEPTGSETSLAEFSELAEGDVAKQNAIYDCIEESVKTVFPGRFYSMAYRS